MSTREHGTHVKYVIDRCRCTHCRRAATAYERHRQRKIGYGRWQPYIDAEPARTHVRRLMAAGLGHRRVAALAGVSHGAVSKLVYGDYKGRPPSAQIRADNAARLLAVRADIDTLGGGTSIDATGTRRRLQALITRGWSQRKLAGQLGMFPTNFGNTLHGDRVQVATARRVRGLYDRLWDTPPPEATASDKAAASRARGYARRHGWAPPMAWDDDTIDDPTTTPDGAAPVSTAPGRRSVPPVDELRFLLAAGESIDTIADRFHVRPATVTDKLSRHTEKDAA